MHVLLLTQYFAPETVGAGIWIHELAQDLRALGNEVTVLTAFPNYPSGKVFDEYKGRIYSHETLDGIVVVRSWIYSLPNKKFIHRLLQFSSFCLSALVAGLLMKERPDVIYAILPP